MTKSEMYSHTAIFEPLVPSSAEVIPFPKPVAFVDRTMSDLRSTFAKHKHNPSPAMWRAIGEIAETIGKMASGTLDPLFYVSALDPGVGKSQTIVHSVRNLGKDVGVLICLSRIEEISNLVTDMGLDEHEYAVFVSENSLERLSKKSIKLGSNRVDTARVLFTTQQMVDSRLHKAESFSRLHEFYYKGEPRIVRLWDEAMLPGEELTLNLDQIGKLPALARKIDQKLADRLINIISSINGSADGSIHSMPDLEADHDKALRYLANNKEAVSKADRDSALVLRQLSDKPVRVTRDANGKTLITYRESLPDDFAPVLILDASARVRKTYKLWKDNRKTLYTLGTAHKNYKNLNVHIWDTGGGKSAWRTNLNELIEGIVATIKTKPDEEWLVIVHKEDRYFIPDLAGEINALLPDHPSKPHYLTWGDHHATNEYANVRNVILAGTLFYQPSTYEVRLRVSAAHPVTEPIQGCDLEDLEKGEHSHLILQALCRGSVRKCIDDCCFPMDAYIIAASNTGIPKLLPEIFPGCIIQRWQPIEKPLQGYIKRAVEAIDECFKDVTDPNYALPFKRHREMLRIKTSQQYKNRIRDHLVFQDELKKRGIREVGYGRGNRKTHFWRASF